MNVSFDLYAAIAISRRLVKCNLPACGILAMSPTELAEHLVSDASLSYATSAFNSASSSFSTWVGMCMASDLRDRLRRKNVSSRRDDAREEHIGDKNTRRYNLGDDVRPRMPPALKMSVNLEDLPARITITKRHRGGRTGHATASQLAAIDYKNEHGLQWKDMVRKFQSEPSFHKLFGFKKCPSRSSLFAFPNRVQRFMAKAG